MLKTISRPKILDLVAGQLKDYIVNGNLKPGDRLPNEADLAQMLGVSRLTLREATKSLEYLGILDAKPGRGLSAGSINMDRVTDCIRFHPALNSIPPEQLIGTRCVIETGVVPYVCENMRHDPAIYDRLNSINADLAKAETLERRIELDISFHRELIAAGGLPPLLPFVEILTVCFQQFRESVSKARWPAGVRGHQRVIDALRDGNAALAAEELRRHIETINTHK